MSPRSIRRAAARQAVKQANKANLAAQSSAPSEPFTKEISERRLAANRTNAQLSTGPTSEAGKRTASLNAVKTGLTGQTILLPSDDVAAYQALIAAFLAQYQPATPQERQLVQNLADTRWRLNRIPALEFALFARGRHQFAEKFADFEPALADALIDAETLVVYAKQLKNLHTQESRLRRQYQHDLAELNALQTERRQAEADAATKSMQPGTPVFDPAASDHLGFEFATDDFETPDTSAVAPCHVSAHSRAA